MSTRKTEYRIQNREDRRQKTEDRTPNPNFEPRTANSEPRTPNPDRIIEKQNHRMTNAPTQRKT
jgi:hypothetical protein